MGRAMVAALRQVLIDRKGSGDGTGGDPPAANARDIRRAAGDWAWRCSRCSRSWDRCLAAVCVGSLVVAWLRRPDRGGWPGGHRSRVRRDSSPVGFVSGAAAGRWLPATVLMLAATGVLAMRGPPRHPWR